MSRRNYSLIAAIALVLGLDAPVRAFVPNDGQRRDLAGAIDPEMLTLLASAEHPVEWAWVQGGPPNDGGRRGPGGPRRGPEGGPGGRRRFNGPIRNDRPPFPPRILNQLRNLRPEERERVLQNNPRFRELPPERKAQLMNRLNMLLEMNEDQRRDLDRRLSVFRNLSPEQRRKAREIYEHHWRTLAPDRRVAILEEFRNLRDMSAEDRVRRTGSDEYQTQFNTEERALLEELSSL